jgi:bifunctional non-homologous end joining protein LigD
MVLSHKPRSRRTGFAEPCLPSPAKAPPSGPGWIHEIKHDGFRIIARRDARGVRLVTRNGNDFSARFPNVATAVNALPVRSCLIDGEAIVTDDRGLAVLEMIRKPAA